MAGRAGLPRVLFAAACAAALLLAAAVLAAPWLDRGDAQGGRLLALFAHDEAVRRTSLAGAAGLVVTACVFFRPGPQRPRPRPRRGFGGGA
jgi:hypothetical protein